MASTELQPSLPLFASSQMLPSAYTATTETTLVSGKNTWSSGLSASIRICERSQRICSSSGMS